MTRTTVSYHLSVLRQVYLVRTTYMGKASALLQSVNNGNTGFVILMQVFSLEAYMEKCLKMSAFVKAQNLT